MNQMDRLKAAVAKGVEMRAAQRAYFKTRDRGDLDRSKRLEREFDKVAAEASRDDDLLERPTRLSVRVGELPPAALHEGAEADVTDALPSVVGAIVIGGGSRKVKVRCDGETWRIAELGGTEVTHP